MAREGSAVFAKSVQSISTHLTAVTLGKGTPAGQGEAGMEVSACASTGRQRQQ